MRSLFGHIKVAKGVAVATSLCGITLADKTEFLNVKLEPYDNVGLKQFKTFKQAKLSFEYESVFKFRSLRELISNIDVPSFSPILTTVACDGSVNISSQIPPSPKMGESTITTVENERIKVLLYDSKTCEESIISRGCHIVFSWGLFAAVWASVVAFPAVTIWAIVDGAWTTVASIVGVWAASLLVRVPSSDEVRRFLFRGMHKWFPHVDIIYEQEPAEHNTIFCCHPHGIFSVGAAVLLDDLNYRKLKDGRTREVGIIAAPYLRWCSPVFKCVTDLIGVLIHGAGRREVRKLFETGEAVTLVPGGFSEATISCVGKERIYINERKGFVKYALRAGYSLTPVYAFGESDLYYNPQGMWKFRLFLNSMKFQIPGVIPFGYPLAPLAPRRVPLRVVCGPPLQLPKIKSPTDEDVNHYHAKYVAAVEELYYRNVDSYHEEVYSKYIKNDESTPRPLERW